MPRSALFMSVLFCLLIFQSLWNVAAAFCAHENQEKALHHFGHHAALSYESS
ncbi:cation transporter, partial [Acinetobacter nosocomialis]